jgi:hypothetical protein
MRSVSGTPRGFESPARTQILTLEEEYSMGFKVQELRTVRTLLKEHRDELLEAWEKHFSA